MEVLKECELTGWILDLSEISFANQQSELELKASMKKEAIMQGKTIQIFLPGSNPRGIRLADITSRTVQVLEIPRAKISEAAKRTELNNVGVYFLIGSDEETDSSIAYVGEAEECLNRLKQHHQHKDFWKSALVCVSKTKYFTKTHVKYLEWLCHDSILKAGRYKLDNTNVPSRPFLSESMVADLEDNFETLKVLVSTLGYPLFEELKVKEENNLIYCRSKDADATGEWTEEGIVVFEGSTAKLDEAPSAIGTWVSKIRSELIASGVLVALENYYRFDRSHVFSSPSAAAVAVLGRNANGWTEWKFEDGRSLDELRNAETN